MKNYWNAFVVVASLFIFSACSLSQPGSQQSLVADDLYDSFQKPASAYTPKKSSHYLNPEEDATLIQEEEGAMIREDETNFLNSRSVYANSYADGFNGLVDNFKVYDYEKTDFSDRFNERGSMNDQFIVRSQ